MAQDTQLLALLKARDLDEQRALQHAAEVEKVVAERQQKYNELLDRKSKLQSRLKELAGKNRVSALQQQDISAVLSVTRFSEKLQTEADEIEAALEERAKELQTAADRLQLAEQEVIAARIEKKKVERFLEERNRKELIHGSAVEEIISDELNTNRRSK